MDKPASSLNPALLQEQIDCFKTVQKVRHVRNQPHVLVVEDQLFSRKLLQETLRGICTCDEADNAMEGLKLYLENAPDIAFLDIELTPDATGHMLARVIREIDPKAYIVMVTGNNSFDDIAEAKSNHVAGFIVKPFSKQKIEDLLVAYRAAKQKGKL